MVVVVGGEGEEEEEDGGRGRAFAETKMSSGWRPGLIALPHLACISEA